MKRFSICIFVPVGLAWLMAGLLAGPARAQFVTAGSLYVDLRATNASAGTATWINQGTLGHFTRVGAPYYTNSVAGTGIPGVVFGGSGQYYTGPVTVSDLEGSSDRSVEVWVFNPSIPGEETLVSWARRGGPEGSNFSINYGDSQLWGAVGHWGGNTYDMGWPTPADVPAANQWHHFVYTYDGDRTCRFYVDGALVIPRVQPTPLLTHAGQTINIGAQREANNTFSLLFSGFINAVRVHGGMLSPSQVATNFAAGPHSIPATGPVEFTLQPRDVVVGEGGGATFRTFATGEAPVTYQWFRDNIPLAGATNRDITLGLVSLADDGARFFCRASNFFNAGAYTAASLEARLTVLSAGRSLEHRYSFNSNANDEVGSAHGILLGGATVAGGELVLNGVGAFLDLPNSLVMSNDSITLEAWVTDTGSGNWARIYDFGNSTGGEGGQGSGTQYMFLSLPSGFGNLRGAYTVSGGGSGEQIVEWSGGRPPAGQKAHIVWTSDAGSQQGRLYVDGVQVGANNAMTLTPAAFGPTVNNWIGKSQFSADAYFNGRIDELRIYRTALSPVKVLENLAAGPDQPPRDGPVEIIGQPIGTTVIENSPATFAAQVSGRPPFQVQWFKNDIPIPGGTRLAVVFSPALADDNALIRMWATNTVDGTRYFAASSNALLRVLPDTVPPVLVRASGIVPDTVVVLFSEGVSTGTGTFSGNYTLTGPSGAVAVTAAAVSADGTTVTLRTDPLVSGQQYVLLVTNVQDRAATPNTIVAPARFTFTASPFEIVDIGGPAQLGMFAGAEGGYNLAGTGTGVGGTNDQFTFACRDQAGDFDLAVRLGSLGLSDVWAIAGLMARDGLGTQGAFAASWATPGPAGCFFQARSSAGSAAALSGSFPVNYPDTWLRLRRAGDLFEGFASIDGRSWATLGSATLLLPSSVRVGLAVSSANAMATTTAAFRDFGDAGGEIVPQLVLPFEPMGPCSRKTGLVFSEIMYNPPDAWSTGRLEFVEIHNTDLITEDLSGWRLEGDIQFTFPPGTLLPSGGYLVVAGNPPAAAAFYGLSSLLGPFTNNLPNEGGMVRLANENGGRLLDLTYDDKHPWPVAADGAGHSLVLRRPSYGENDPRAWGVSDRIGGSPGRGDGWGVEPLRSVVINEFLAHTDPPLLDFIELYNASNDPVDLSGAWLSDDLSAPKYQIPTPTLLPGRGFISFNEQTLGFALSSNGDEIVLVNPSRTRVIAAMRFGGQAGDVSRGRVPDGSPMFSELATPTPGASNSPALRREMVINEIMYNPISGSNDDEYIELHNRSGRSVDISGWHLSDGIRFAFPEGAIVPAGGYVVVANNLTNLLSRYPHLTLASSFGNYGGSLANGGERVVLEMPLVTVRTNAQQQRVTNISFITVNEVTYGDGGRWGRWSDGGGSSLELIDPEAETRFAAYWADSDESGKAPWTTIDYTAKLDNGMSSGNGAPNRFELFLQAAGECLVDDLECRSGTGPNLINNPGFESGATGWNWVGTHRPSYLETGVGMGGSRALHLVAVDRGDPGPNKVWTGMASMSTGLDGTVRAKVRWLRGSPHILLRVRGQWIEAMGTMNLPANLGTPGLPNSRLVANAGPALAEVTHAPVLPAAAQTVLVSARVHDPDGIGSVTLHYRVDPESAYAALPMRDEGTGGDRLAGDGLYSAVIPGQQAGVTVAFYISALDAAMTPAPGVFPEGAPGRGCLVHWDAPRYAGSLGVYHLWLAQADIDRWNLRERNSNEPIDCTFAYGNSRVVYNAATLYSGSPWHTRGHPYTGPLGTLCDYEVNFPPDDRFLGSRDFVLNGQDFFVSFFNNDLTGQAEYLCYWMARRLGLQYNHKRTVLVTMNGRRRGMLYYDHQQPNQEIVSQYFPDDDEGPLHKIEDWFEFDDAGNNFDVLTATLENFTTTGGLKKTARYRYNWRPRAVRGSPNAFTDLFTLVDAVNADGTGPFTPATTSATLGLMDVENWMRVFALQHTAGNWDTYGYRRGKNAYAYKPGRGPWKLLVWDIELVLGKNSDGPTHPLFDLGNPAAADQGEPIIQRMYNHPPFVRAFWRALVELVNGPMLPASHQPLLEARYDAYTAHGLPVEHPSSLAGWIAARRNYILTQIPQAVFRVNETNLTSAGDPFIALSGAAPVEAAQVVVNGNAYPMVWSNVTNWSMTVPLVAGLNRLTVQALDRWGNPLPGGSIELNVTYTGTDLSPVGQVVFNEIMYNAAIPRTSYVELYNRSATASFDLSGWRIDGLNYTIPLGTIIRTQQVMLVARNQWSLANVYGAALPLLGTFEGELNNQGETISLIKPGPDPQLDLVVDRVRYENEVPWPVSADGQGPSLQLIDAAQDNSRVSNWSDGLGWRFFRTTGIVGSLANRVILALAEAGDVYIDNVELVLGTEPGAGPNILQNGGFESGSLAPWTYLRNHSNTVVTAAVAYAGSYSMHLIATGSGSTGDYVQQSFALIPSTAVATFSFYYLPTAPNRLKYRVGTGLLDFTQGFEISSVVVTPGTRNAIEASLPPYDPIWLNEVAPNGTAGFTDSQGQTEPWLELFNAGTNDLALDGLSLANRYDNLLQWTFPPGAMLAPGQFLVVWADGEPGQSGGTEFHTHFRLTNGTGSVVLSRLIEGTPQILDYFNYRAVPANHSYGAVPDGQPFYRRVMFHTTPGAANNGAAAPLALYINEWMAANTSASGIADPADNDYDDWFELHNPGPAAANLAGYYLTDNLLDPFRFRVPEGYAVPPRGFLLVWADNETGQNRSDRADLHVNFRLSQEGEQIGLFAPDGTAVDNVTFGPQTNNISQGRYPDGTGPVYFMTIPTPRAPNIVSTQPASPRLAGLILEPNGSIAFTFETVPGQTYRVEYTDDLAAPDWRPLRADEVAAASTVTVRDLNVTGTVRQRFYRILLLP